MYIYVRLPRLMSLAPEHFASLPSKEREKGRFPEALGGRACSRFSDLSKLETVLDWSSGQSRLKRFSKVSMIDRVLFVSLLTVRIQFVPFCSLFCPRPVQDLKRLSEVTTNIRFVLCVV